MFSSIYRGRVLNIAHRGARSLAPENTLASARKAFEAGADMWELDVSMTADDELVVIHDRTLERTSNVKEIFPSRYPWRACDFTLEELRRLDFGSWFVETDPFKSIASGDVSGSELESYAGQPVPTLREALHFTRSHNRLVNVEIKDLEGTPGAGHSMVVERVVALVEELKMAGSVLLSSFNHGYLRRAKAANSHIPAGALVDTMQSDPTSLLERLGAEAHHPRVGTIRPGDIASLRDRGLEVFVWVANDEKTMRALIKARASGIFTDFPQVLRAILHD